MSTQKTTQKDVESWELSDELREKIEPLLPKPKSRFRGRGRHRHHVGGRPAADRLRVMAGILYVLRTGCQWNAVPKEFGSGKTLHRYFQKWTRARVFKKLWKAGLLEYDRTQGIVWTWQAVDGAMTKAPLGGGATGPNPTDRAKSGTKRSLLTDGRGAPLGIVVSGANRHDSVLLEPTLEAVVIPRPKPTQEHPQHLCADQAYNGQPCEQTATAHDYILHRSSGKKTAEGTPVRRSRGKKARRWVVEVAHAWINRFRRLLVRWEKKTQNYLSMLYFACAIICWRKAAV
jgi:putative transposase